MLNITTFNIYGYSLEFDENVYEYDLDIDSDVSKIYLETTCNDCEITGDKWIDITDKDQVVVKYTKETTEKEYKINLKKSVLASKETEDNN